MASFKKAFADAREANKQTFEWNGKRYNTKLKGEDDKGMRTTKPKKRPTQTAPASSPRPDRKPKVRMSATSPRAPSSSPRPASRADRGSGAVKRSARPAAKPTRAATASQPQANTPSKKVSSPPKTAAPKPVSDRQANKDRAMQTYKEPARKTGTGKTKKPRTLVGKRANFFPFTKLSTGRGRGRD